MSNRTDDGGMGCLIVMGLIALVIGIAGYFGYAGMLVLGCALIAMACFVIWTEQGNPP